MATSLVHRRTAVLIASRVVPKEGDPIILIQVKKLRSRNLRSILVL